jgi:hypothetical protein
MIVEGRAHVLVVLELLLETTNCLLAPELTCVQRRL